MLSGKWQSERAKGEGTMVSWVKEYIFKKFLVGFLKKLEGYKTLMGFIVLVCSVLAGQFPEFAHIFQYAVEYLLTLGAPDFTHLGVGTVLIGIIDKLRRYVKDKRLEAEGDEVPKE